MDITHTTEHPSFWKGMVGLYFGNVNWYRQVACADGDVVYIDGTERYVKQTERNHCRIMAANGVQKLTVPVTYPPANPDKEGTEGKQRLLTKDVLVSDHGNWRHQHWEALKSAYGMSPFFEFYQDDIQPFFEKPQDEATAKEWSTLLGFDMAITRKMFELLGIRKEVRVITDNNGTISSSITALTEVGPYYQTFQRRHGFIPGLSILDLLFNEGPEAITYLCKRDME